MPLRSIFNCKTLVEFTFKHSIFDQDRNIAYLIKIETESLPDYHKCLITS